MRLERNVHRLLFLFLWRIYSLLQCGQNWFQTNSREIQSPLPILACKNIFAPFVKNANNHHGFAGIWIVVAVIACEKGCAHRCAHQLHHHQHLARALGFVWHYGKFRHMCAGWMFIVRPLRQFVHVLCLLIIIIIIGLKWSNNNNNDDNRTSEKWKPPNKRFLIPPFSLCQFAICVYAMHSFSRPHSYIHATYPAAVELEKGARNESEKFHTWQLKIHINPNLNVGFVGGAECFERLWMNWAKMRLYALEPIAMYKCFAFLPFSSSESDFSVVFWKRSTVAAPTSTHCI